jgi:hypothetical protein
MSTKICNQPNIAFHINRKTIREGEGIVQNSMWDLCEMCLKFYYKNFYTPYRARYTWPNEQNNKTRFPQRLFIKRYNMRNLMTSTEFAFKCSKYSWAFKKKNGEVHWTLTVHSTLCTCTLQRWAPALFPCFRAREREAKKKSAKAWTK